MKARKTAGPPAQWWISVAAAAGLVACGSGSSAPATDSIHSDFSNPQVVSIEGFSGDAMEPFISPDGGTLFFNDSNAPGNDTNLYYASRIDDLHFLLVGTIAGANSSVLDAVPSIDRQGHFYFISTRSYVQTLSTIYTGQYADGALSGVSLIQGLSQQQNGALNFDAGISPDGDTLYFVDGTFNGGTVPVTADLAIATRMPGGGFERLSQSAELLQNVNTSALEYAPCISADGLELFFTRASGVTSAIYRASRNSSSEPFGPPQLVSGATGDVVEAPSLSSDGHSLYYHAKLNGTYTVFRVTR